MAISKSHLRLIVLGAAVFGILWLGVGVIWPFAGIDWKETYYPAARALAEGRNPYVVVPTFRNLPWTLFPLLPLSLLPEKYGGILFFILTLGLYGFAAVKLQASRIALIAFLLSPPVMYGLRMLNVDALVLLGFFLPPQVGLFLILIKPQMGMAMIPFWMIEAWRAGGWKSVLRVFLPVVVAVTVSLAIFGTSAIGRSDDLLHSEWNASLWPWAFPIGFALTILSIRNRRRDQAIAASPFLSPYLAYHSWVSVLAGLMKHEFELVLAVAGMWLVALIRILGYG